MEWDILIMALHFTILTTRSIVLSAKCGMANSSYTSITGNAGPTMPVSMRGVGDEVHRQQGT
jgi:hypothetical protein